MVLEERYWIWNLWNTIESEISKRRHSGHDQNHAWCKFSHQLEKVNKKKSVLEPKNIIEFLGCVVTTNFIKLYNHVRTDAIRAYGKCDHKLLGNTSRKVREVSSLVGTIVSTLPAYSFGKPLHRQLERCKMDDLQAALGSFESFCVWMQQR